MTRPTSSGTPRRRGACSGAARTGCRRRSGAATPDPETVRLRLRALLAKARAAQRMPWSERDARMWQIVFPNMAKWLPDAEADQLRFEFAREMERLKPLQ